MTRDKSKTPKEPNPELDNKQVVELYRKVKEQGNAGALYELAVIYENGYGVEENPVLRDLFFLLSARGGNVEAQKVVEKFNEKLTKEQIAAIEEAASALGIIIGKLKK